MLQAFSRPNSEKKKKKKPIIWPPEDPLPIVPWVGQWKRKLFGARIELKSTYCRTIVLDGYPAAVFAVYKIRQTPLPLEHSSRFSDEGRGPLTGDSRKTSVNPRNAQYTPSHTTVALALSAIDMFSPKRTRAD
ncbi:hypothetical protein EYC84_009470 [Monilinia fructicola]|uniref:Uncharacterized protein n=1 Tax=Monilinia fructicola TaxID=38448 RepID=A0A5M9J7P5_MONFR|nr:hypothetical protein EYC84_009470 [Monilinia fructicola]